MRNSPFRTSLQPLQNGFGYESGYVAPKARHLTDEGGGEKSILLIGGKEYGFRAAPQLAVHLGHLKFVLEIGDSP